MALVTGVTLVGGMAVGAAAAPVALPDATQKADLTIHKHQTPKSQAGDGLAQEVSSKPIKGVVFEACKVDVDLTTLEGWLEAQEMVTEGGSNSSAVQTAMWSIANRSTDCVTGTTGTNGEYKFENMDLGLYVVEEIDGREATIDGERVKVIPSSPFVVALPMTHPTDLDKWNYDVHVYPKNDTINITKSVKDDTAVDIDDTVTFTIVADVPQPGDGRKLATYTIIDDLDERLDFVSASLVVTHPAFTWDDDQNPDTPEVPGDFAPDVDYRLTPEEATTGGPTIQAYFGEGGRAKLDKVVKLSEDVKITLTIVAKANRAGEIPNQATVMLSDGNETFTPTSNIVETKFGGVSITKTAKDTGAPLENVGFKVYVDGNGNGTLESSDTLVEIGGKSEWFTDDEGLLTIEGLRYSFFENGAEPDTSPIKYLLVESKAPAGYELLAAALPFTLDASDPFQESCTGEGDGRVCVDTFRVDEQDVVNVAHNAGFTLPLVGGAGTIALTIGGLGVLVLALVLVRRRSEA